MSARRKRNVQDSSEVPQKVPRKWRDNEIETLISCVMKYGHKNLPKIQEYLPGRSIENIKTFLRTAHDKAIRLEKDHDNVDGWIELCNSSIGTPWTDCLQVAQVLKYLSVDGLLENHPLQTPSQGIDFGSAYRLIYQAVMGYPIQPVNEPTADFILQTLIELKSEFKKQTAAIQNVDSFLQSNNQKEFDLSSKKTDKSNNKAEENTAVKKPLKVYQRKKSNVNKPEIAPSLKIIVEEKNSEATSSSKDFSVTVEGSDSNASATIAVPMPHQKKVNQDEEELLQSTSYNPFKIPGKWLEEPFHISHNEVPPIVPCYNGKSLKIHEDLVVNGLSAISIKHHRGNCKDDRRSSENGVSKTRQSVDDAKDIKDNDCESRKLSDISCKGFRSGVDGPECLKDKMKRRNSFWNVHRPELSKLTWPENFVSSTVLQDFFHNHLKIHGTFCEPLHEFSNRSSIMDEEFRNYSKLREIIPPRVLPPDEKVVSIMEKSRSVQLNDEDLDPEIMVHKSRAEFCVTIGEYIRRPLLKRTTSQQMPKCYVQPASRYESLPVQHEGLLSKEAMFSEEKVSAVIGSTELCLNAPVAIKSSKKLSLGNISGIFLKKPTAVDSQRLVATSPSSLNNSHQQCSEEVTEDSGDPAGLRTILSPRDETAEESRSRHF